MSLSHFNKSYCLIFFAVCHIVVGDPVEDDIAAIKKVLKDLSNNNRRLEKENEILKIELWDLKSEVSKLQKFEVMEDGQEESIDSKSKMRNRRLLIGQTTTTSSAPEPAHSIAFYAYMSKSEPTPSNHHTLIFDVIKTNLGNGYSKYSGTFIAPSDGTYVFTWTINTDPGGAHYINLMVNGAIVGGSVTDTRNGNYDSDSSTVVVVIKKGDNVNLRTTAATLGSSTIFVDVHAFTSFAGWRIGS